MDTKAASWGNSLGVRIPQNYARDLGIEKGSNIEIFCTGGAITTKPKKKKKTKYKIEDLASWQRGFHLTAERLQGLSFSSVSRLKSVIHLFHVRHIDIR